MKTTKIILTLLVLVLAVSFVLAAKDETTAQTSEKNMTYGKCVSLGAEQKNVCYDTSKEAEKTCKEAAGTDDNAEKKCSIDYKKAKSDCKSAFKAAKNECKKIKHNFFETIASSMK